MDQAADKRLFVKIATEFFNYCFKNYCQILLNFQRPKWIGGQTDRNAGVLILSPHKTFIYAMKIKLNYTRSQETLKFKRVLGK